MNNFYMSNRLNRIANKTVYRDTPIGSELLPDPKDLDPNHRDHIAKYYNWLGWSTAKTGAVVNASTTFSVNTTLYARYTITPPFYTHIPASALPYKDDIPYDLHPLRAAVPADFARGVDISSVLEIEYYNGLTFRDFDNQIDDVMKILTQNGINYVRLRLWVDPEAAMSGEAGGGTSLEVKYHHLGDANPYMGTIKVIAARAKAAGMKFLLAYHFSDWWADPGKQYVPLSWINTPAGVNNTYAKVASYVKETVEEFKAAGATPDMIALGNEMQGGFLTGYYPSGSWNSGGT
jgi:hypothetical protein